MKQFGVTGHPVLHSRSPVIFRHLWAAGGVDATYTRIGAETAGAALSLARRAGFAGLNVTAPFKEPMWGLASERDDWATRLGAANTMALEAAEARAFNTDPAGVSRALAARNIRPAGARVVVLGAGGAARAAIATLVSDGADVIVASRTTARAAEAAARLGCSWAEFGSLPHLLSTAAGLVSCLPAGVDPVDEGSLHPSLWVLDANYTRSALGEKASRRGCVVLSGLDWLLGQALASHRLFTAADAGSPGHNEQFGEDTVADVARLLAASGDGEPRRALAIAGMMGAGKSRAGRELARRLGRDFIDTDDLIAERSGHDIRWLFTRRSEQEFRRIEADTIARAVDGRPSVVALGGGSLEDETTRARVRRCCRVVWLWASPKCLAARTAAHGAGRPLLDGHDPEARLSALLAARTRTYASAADLVVDAERSIDEVASLVEFELARIEER